jgi:hypothetical protein
LASAISLPPDIIYIAIYINIITHIENIYLIDNIQIPVLPLHIQKKIIEHLDKLSNIIESRNIIDNIIFEIKNDTNIA